MSSLHRLPVGVVNAIDNITADDLFDVNARWSNPPGYVTRAIRYIHTLSDALHAADYVSSDALIALAVSIRHLEAYMAEINRGYHNYPVNADTSYFFRRYRGYFTTIKNYLRRSVKAVDGGRAKSRSKKSTYRASKNKRPAARRKTRLYR